jgi:hypothetical protein
MIPARPVRGKGEAMQIFNTMIANDQEGTLFICDTIEHEGYLWLVPEWCSQTRPGVMWPRRIIRLSGLPYQTMSGEGFGGANFLLNAPIPKGILDGTIPSERAAPYVVQDLPPIERPNDGTLH